MSQQLVKKKGDYSRLRYRRNNHNDKSRLRPNQEGGGSCPSGQRRGSRCYNYYWTRSWTTRDRTCPSDTHKTQWTYSGSNHSADRDCGGYAWGSIDHLYPCCKSTNPSGSLANCCKYGKDCVGSSCRPCSSSYTNTTSVCDDEMKRYCTGTKFLTDPQCISWCTNTLSDTRNRSRGSTCESLVKRYCTGSRLFASSGTYKKCKDLYCKNMPGKGYGFSDRSRSDLCNDMMETYCATGDNFANSKCWASFCMANPSFRKGYPKGCDDAYTKYCAKGNNRLSKDLCACEVKMSDRTDLDKVVRDSYRGKKADEMTWCFSSKCRSSKAYHDAGKFRTILSNHEKGRYDQLIAKKKAKTISSSENTELIGLDKKIGSTTVKTCPSCMQEMSLNVQGSGNLLAKNLAQKCTVSDSNKTGDLCGFVNCGTYGKREGCQCVCNTGFTGEYCDKCQPACKNGGSPTIAGSLCLCKCNPRKNWSGTYCDSCNLKSGDTCKITGKKIGWPWSLDREKCMAKCKRINDECKHGGTIDLDTCQCKCVGDWEGEDCGKCKHTNNPGYCNNRGTVDPKTCKCVCDAPWTGDNCEKCQRTDDYCKTDHGTGKIDKKTDANGIDQSCGCTDCTTTAKLKKLDPLKDNCTYIDDQEAIQAEKDAEASALAQRQAEVAAEQAKQQEQQGQQGQQGQQASYMVAEQQLEATQLQQADPTGTAGDTGTAGTGTAGQPAEAKPNIGLIIIVAIVVVVLLVVLVGGGVFGGKKAKQAWNARKAAQAAQAPPAGAPVYGPQTPR